MGNKDLTALYNRQIQEFPLARNNFQALEQVICRDIPFPHIQMRVQYNPARIISTNAKIDQTTLRKRNCFLCPSHMPEEQKGIPYGEKYNIYINPYPIFHEHFTVPSNEHTPQLIAGRFTDLLDIARTFPAYTVFYNGPASGASAPDHFHFQIVPRHIMPLEQDTTNKQLQEIITQNNHITLYRLKNYIREVFILQSPHKEHLQHLFDRLQTAIGQVITYEQEPRFNLLSWYSDFQWTVAIFPRKCWRPRQFFLEGNKQIMFSPGCVDMAGLIIAPRKEDYERYTPELLTDLFNQVSINTTELEAIIFHLKQKLSL
ncbi:MAG: DUF4922 domain-containing protein [Odoribacter sp.]|nr:DUF4922 domain-containing protein [Odoribacter sp.]MDY3032734.1 DUF4922 domain-containing protein [Odoribacter sp.]